MESAPRVSYVSVASGLLAGITSAGLFNPIDRALYLSVKNEIPFLSKENFASPYTGFFQSVGHRAISGGLYYPLEQFFLTQMSPTPAMLLTSGAGNTTVHNFLAGTAAGSCNAIIVNPISAVKYKTWGRENPRGFFVEAADMLRKGGIRPFTNGMLPTVLRDLVFGGCYTVIRFELQYRFQLSNNDYQWAANMAAAAMATIVSGPFNLARNVQYATRSHKAADSVIEVFVNFLGEVKELPTALQKCKHVQNRLRIGWGTARVAIGMSFGHFVYDRLHSTYYQLQKEGRVI
ncbi:unnamed protein product [Cylindrotheca closterium]|uniref:Mitochondrial carrier protein n=1 Tax=Cylindrotheca closterium TaxID=2856 RepID=A0AAD2CFZ0_9STRA|nr:unnamed protein product [Cylindrotheca closterium]